MKKKFSINNFVSLFALIFIIVFFEIASNGKLLSGNNPLYILDQSIAVIIGGLGMIFVIAQGSIDISQGSLLGATAAVAAIVVNNFGVVWLFPAGIAIGTLIGLFNGVIVSKFKVPSFMVTLSMLIALRAFVALMFYSAPISATAELMSIDNYIYKIPIFIFLILLLGYLFEYTKIGFYSKSIGENELANKFSGVSTDKYKILAFMISGIMASIAGILSLAHMGGASATMGNMFEFKVMMSLFVGGVPIYGGMQSRIYKLIIGAPTIIILVNGLVICNIAGPISEGIQGIVLVLVVFASVYLNRRSLVRVKDKTSTEEE